MTNADDEADRVARPKLSRVTYAAVVAGVATVYVLAARAGLTLDAVSGFAALVWPPTGIALAAILLGGRRLWPGVFIGAVVANVLTGAPLLTAAGIGTGNTLEAVVGAFALTRVAGFRLELDRVRDVLALIAFAAMLSPVISATIGVGSLHVAGLVQDGQFRETWFAWWVGDAIGALLVAPVILVWGTQPRLDQLRRRAGEAALLLALLVVASIFIFIVPVTRLGHAYVFFPLLMWAAIRFEQRGAVTATLIVSALAITGTVVRQGPFTEPTLHESLLSLQTFMGITGATFLVLAASVAERERSKEELRAARDLANAANRAKADFLAVMSHELRTPLNAIAGYAQLLKLGVSGQLTEKQTDAVDRIRGNQEHLLGLIDEILSFAKIEAGSSRVAATRVSVCQAIDSLEPLLRPALERQQLEFSSSGCEPALAVRADPLKLRQVLLNVVGNAIKFTPARGRIEISAARRDGRVVIRVSDTGIGIPPEQIERVFEPFFQVQSGTTREYPGVGLGLAIARDFTRAMGGEIAIESSPQKGCTVFIELPADDPGAAAGNA